MRDTEKRAVDAYKATFGSDPEVVASAPGRVNLIGEHTDYNGGFVLPCAIDRRLAVAVTPGTGGLYSADFEETVSLTAEKTGSWSDYPSGVAWSMREAGLKIPEFQAAFAGNVPLAAGLSSSAAIEAGTAISLDALFRLGQSRQDLAVLCRRAENGFVGVNSGILDQYASLLCTEGTCLLIDCRSLEATSVPLDLDGAGLVLMVCDTGVERKLGATGYNDRRATCERAAARIGVKELRDARVEDLSQLSGEELRRARHVVTEDARVLNAVQALESNDFEQFGRLMYESHASLRDDYEVSTPELDAFVERARAAGALGARLTGAGFGGCAIAIIAPDRVDALKDAVERQYAEENYPVPTFYIFHPSAGAEVVQPRGLKGAGS